MLYTAFPINQHIYIPRCYYHNYENKQNGIKKKISKI